MLILVNQDKQGQSSYEEHYYNFQINFTSYYIIIWNMSLFISRIVVNMY